MMAPMSFQDIFLGFLVALAAGALIGIERQQAQSLSKRLYIGGVRTFPLIALTGALSALLSHTMGVWPVLLALLVVGSLLTVSFYEEWEKERSSGATTQVAAFITFLLGVLALLPDLPLETGQRYLLIIASAGVVMALLSFKEPLHQAVARVSPDDIYATAKFVILALIVLPLLPDRTVDPLHVLNPFNIGLMIVLIAGISFVGYIAARVLGEGRSVLWTGLLGGLVSSTAVTVSLAPRIRRTSSLASPVAVAIAAASATMFTRILVIMGTVDPPLLTALVWPLGAMTLAGYGAALVVWWRSAPPPVGTDEVAYRNPFELRTALQFGAFYALVLLVAKGAQAILGNLGLYLSSMLAGTTDVDAISLSISRFHQGGLTDSVAATAVTLAAITNTVVKAGLAWWLGGWHLASRVLPILGIALGAGALALIVLW